MTTSILLYYLLNGTSKKLIDAEGEISLLNVLAKIHLLIMICTLVLTPNIGIALSIDNPFPLSTCFSLLSYYKFLMKKHQDYIFAQKTRYQVNAATIVLCSSIITMFTGIT
ncbi:hypothetical protein BDA99DRAFT_539190 [Phascolomyces articulosus]|uniref:Uncharacterized protein n=1 Tax=Phascolomyces articulosus TaxID=60185 RepID=A0AAD5JX88_9FUNG|nr:hypothetical protein BDA99DRAFT_539190 [Phascolomyces articulosus]